MTDLQPLAIYVHWPYCARICPYCDFNIYKQREDPKLALAIVRDLEHWRSLSGERRVSSIHFGGGTPSLMSSKEIRSVISRVRELWACASNMEIALEANPSNRDRLEEIAAAGVNRLSLGIQSFHDEALSFLGRDHTGRDSRRALAGALDLFPSVSVDLIFGWIGQSGKDWDQDLSIAIDSGAPHISTYQLTIEDNTAFARAQARGERKAVSPDDSASLYAQMVEHLDSSGYEHYEVSNFARPAHRSQQNLAYWRGHDYVGVGPGAHGRLTQGASRVATVTAAKPENYCGHVDRLGHGIVTEEDLSRTERADEYVIMGLRISEGIALSRWEELSDAPLPYARIQELCHDQLLIQDEDRLYTSEKGRILLNAITDKLLT